LKQFVSEAPKDSDEYNKYVQAVLDYIEGEYKKENPDAVFSDEKVLAVVKVNDEADSQEDAEENEEDKEEIESGSDSSNGDMNGDVELNLEGEEKNDKTKHIIPKDSIELLHEAQAKKKQEEEEEASHHEEDSKKKSQAPQFNEEYLSSMDWNKVGKLPLSSYDPIKREPRFVNSEASSFFELVSRAVTSYYRRTH